MLSERRIKVMHDLAEKSLDRWEKEKANLRKKMRKGKHDTELLKLRAEAKNKVEAYSIQVALLKQILEIQGD